MISGDDRWRCRVCALRNTIGSELTAHTQGGNSKYTKLVL